MSDSVAVDRDRLVETASRMIGVHSFTGDEEGMARLMVELFEARGLHVQWQQVEEGRANALGTWAGQQPDAASAYIQAMPPGDAKNRALGAVVASLAWRDVEAARTMVDQMPTGAFRNQAMQNLAQQWSQNDPPAAAEFVLTMMPGEGRNNAIQSIVQNWARSNVQDALTWAAQLPDGERRNALQGIGWQWAQSDPRAAAEYFARNAEGNEGIIG